MRVSTCCKARMVRAATAALAARDKQLHGVPACSPMPTQPSVPTVPMPYCARVSAARTGQYCASSEARGHSRCAVIYLARSGRARRVALRTPCGAPHTRSVRDGTDRAMRTGPNARAGCCAGCAPRASQSGMSSGGEAGADRAARRHRRSSSPSDCYLHARYR